MPGTRPLLRHRAGRWFSVPAFGEVVVMLRLPVFGALRFEVPRCDAELWRAFVPQFLSVVTALATTISPQVREPRAAFVHRDIRDQPPTGIKVGSQGRYHT